MQRFLPIFGVVVLGLALIVGGVWFFTRSKKDVTPAGGKRTQEQVVKELPIEERPFVSLTPRADGHEFHLTISNIPGGTESVEYELVYKVASGVTQGVPGTVKVSGKSSIERDLLLGTCSSGKCRYDEGVEQGTFTLRLRDGDGKLITKLETDFHLQKGGQKLTSEDGKFAISSAITSSKDFYLIMETFGLPRKAPGKVASGPYGIFSQAKNFKTVSSGIEMEGSGDLYIWSGGQNWSKLEGSRTFGLGTFIRIASE